MNTSESTDQAMESEASEQSPEDDKVNLADDLGIDMRPMKNTIVLAVSFLFIFTAFQGIQNIQSSINQKEGLGVASLSCLYGVAFIGSIMTPFLIHCCGIKATFIYAFTSFCIYTASNFYPDWWTLVPSSILLGLSVAPMWIGRHLYINGMGLYDSQAIKVDLHGSLSRYNGVFYSFFHIAQVSGNLISSVVLHQSRTDQSDLNATRICGADDCPGVESRTTKIVRPDAYVIDILLGIYLACGLLGLLLTAVFLRPLKLEKTDKKASLRKVMACCTVFTDKKLLLLIPLTISQAMNTSILLTGFTKAFISCTVGVKMVGYVMMTFGAVTSLAAITFGHLAKYTGRIPLMALSLCVDLLTLLSMLLWKPVPEQQYLLFVIPCIWALGDGIWMSQIMSLVSIAFPTKQPAVFSNKGVWASFGFTFVLASDQFLCLGTKLYIVIVFWCAGLLCYSVLERILVTESREKSDYQKIEGDSKLEHVRRSSKDESADLDKKNG